MSGFLIVCEMLAETETKKPVNQDGPGWRASLSGACPDFFVRAGK
jgi:hypothetical protein